MKFGTLTVIGRDRTGVVARVTGFLFKQKANVEALEEQVTRGQFSMTMQASWKNRHLDKASIRRGLKSLCDELGMESTIRFKERRAKQRMAILVTKEPHCLERLLKTIDHGSLNEAEPVLILSNRRDLEPLAKALKIPFVWIPWDERAKAELTLLRVLEEYEVDFLVLARFMKILSANVVWRYKNKILNIHPSLLPSFPGPQAYRQAYEQGVKIVGVSAHFVTMNLDEGPIIAQDCFSVQPGMSLKQIVARGQKLEASTLLKAVKLYLSNQLDVHWGKVKEL